jgi:hypothetical protein
MKKVFFTFFLSLVFGQTVFEARASLLELQYLKLLNDQGSSVEEKVVKPGDALTLEFRYTCRGFSKESVVKMNVELFDAQGNSKLSDEQTREVMEGTRIDRYKLVVPQNISGPFLAVLTLQVVQEDETLSEVVKTVPFEVGMKNSKSNHSS